MIGYFHFARTLAGGICASRKSLRVVAWPSLGRPCLGILRDLDIDNKQLKPDISFFFLAEENHGFGTFRNKCAIDRDRKNST